MLICSLLHAETRTSQTQGLFFFFSRKSVKEHLSWTQRCITYRTEFPRRPCGINISIHPQSSTGFWVIVTQVIKKFNKSPRHGHLVMLLPWSSISTWSSRARSSWGSKARGAKVPPEPLPHRPGQLPSHWILSRIHMLPTYLGRPHETGSHRVTDIIYLLTLSW